jgi:GNAT superfamily N-acetyltransferase
VDERLGFKIEIEPAPSLDVQQLIDPGLDVFNTQKTGPDGQQDVWVIARDDQETVQGGLKGRTAYSWLFIDWLWLSPDMRGRGLGAELLGKAETEAQVRGCIGAYVDTFSFQAPDFYRRNGYEDFARIDDFPPGHSCIWLKKTFGRQGTKG